MEPSNLDACKEKAAKVSSWLESLLPPHESVELIQQTLNNQKTLDSLFQHMSISEEIEKNVKLTLEDVNTKTLEYEAETKMMQDYLTSMNLSPNDLPHDVQKSLTCLSSIAASLLLEDCSNDSYLLGLLKLFEEDQSNSSHLHEEKNKIDYYSHQLAEMQKKMVVLKRMLEEMNSSLPEKKQRTAHLKKELSFLTAKSSDYEEKSDKLKEQLVIRGLKPELRQAALIRQAEDIRTTKKRIQEIKTRLKHYRDIPPNENLARLKLEEAKKELAILEEEIESKIRFVPGT